MDAVEAVAIVTAGSSAKWALASLPLVMVGNAETMVAVEPARLAVKRVRRALHNSNAKKL